MQLKTQNFELVLKKKKKILIGWTKCYGNTFTLFTVAHVVSLKNVETYSLLCSFRTFWDAITIVVLTLSFICLPVQLAFYVHDLTDASWVSFNLIVDIIFIMDIILNFQTGYLIPATDEVSGFTKTKITKIGSVKVLLKLPTI